MKNSSKHWQNSSEPGQTVFITTTCLDFAHLFKRAEMKNRMVMQLADDHRHYQALLHAFVVMSNHIHLITTLPKEMDIQQFCQRIKTNSSKKLLPLLNDEEREMLTDQQGLNQRKFWQRSFRGFVLEKRTIFHQKTNYIHENPVRAG